MTGVLRTPPQPTLPPPEPPRGAPEFLRLRTEILERSGLCLGHSNLLDSGTSACMLPSIGMVKSRRIE